MATYNLLDYNDYETQVGGDITHTAIVAFGSQVDLAGTVYTVRNIRHDLTNDKVLLIVEEKT